MTKVEAQRVIAKFRSGKRYQYESYAAGQRETIEAQGEGFRFLMQSLDGDDESHYSAESFLELLLAGKRDDLLAWADGSDSS